jgi:phage protein U
VEKDIQELFGILTHMPNRGKSSSESYLSISEIHMNLKKNGAVFPRNIGKEAFLSMVKNLVTQGSKYLVD